MSAHTPGPWSIDPEWMEHITEDGYHTVEAGCGFYGGSEKGFSIQGCISPHDARLIAAAPELLAVADLVAEAAKHKADKDWTMFHIAFGEAAEAARAAIAKATGSRA